MMNTSACVNSLMKLLYGIIVMKNMMCRWAYFQEILTRLFLVSYAPIELRNFAKLNVPVLLNFFFEFFMREKSELWPKYTISCNFCEVDLT